MFASFVRIFSLRIGSTMRNELKDGKKEKEKLPTIGYAKKR